MVLLTTCFRLALITTLITVLFTCANAQTPTPKPESPQRQAESHKEYPPDDVAVLKQQVEQLQSLVEKQQRALDDMDKRLKKLEEKAPADKEGDGVVLVKASLNTGSATNTGYASQPVATGGSASDSAGLETGKGATPPIANGDQDRNKRVFPAAGWTSRPILQSEDGNNTMQFIALGQFDFRGYSAGDHPANTFVIRRARLGIDGKLASYFDYRLNLDFADRTSTIVRDAFVTIHRINELQIRVGQFKEPFSQEEMLPAFGQEFIERSMVNNLAPARSPGVMAFGIVKNGVFEYYVGAFNGKGQLVNNDTNTPEGVLRLRLSPWRSSGKDLIRGLAFGGAVASGRNSNDPSVSGFTESRSFTFFTPDIINGKSTKANGELSWQIGNAVVRAEYDQTNQAREGLGGSGTNLPGVVAKGLLAQFSYLLGGVKQEDGTALPRNDFFDTAYGRPGLGAWELKARYNKLQISNGTAKSNHAETVYFGANWYMNRFIKYQLDFGIERFNDPVRSPNPRDRNYLVVQSRLQFMF